MAAFQQDTSAPGYFPDPSLHSQKGLESRLATGNSVAFEIPMTLFCLLECLRLGSKSLINMNRIPTVQLFEIDLLCPYMPDSRVSMGYLIMFSQHCRDGSVKPTHYRLTTIGSLFLYANPNQE